jgi:hypothetical protein
MKIIALLLLLAQAVQAESCFTQTQAYSAFIKLRPHSPILEGQEIDEKVKTFFFRQGCRDRAYWYERVCYNGHWVVEIEIRKSDCREVYKKIEDDWTCDFQCGSNL